MKFPLTLRACIAWSKLNKKGASVSDNNPYESVENVQQVSSGYWTKWRIAGVVTRFAIFLLIVVFRPFVIAVFVKMFEEYGIELPRISQLAIMYSDRFIRLWFLWIPILFLLYVGFERCVALGGKGLRKVSLTLFWLWAFLSLVYFVVAMGLPSISIIEGLTANR